MKKFLFLVVSLVNCLVANSQNINPPEDEIYREDEVATIRITMEAADKGFLLDDANVWSNEYLPAQFHFKNILLDTLLSFDVGIRLRGNTSRNQPKRSFKIKFKEFDGEKFF